MSEWYKMNPIDWNSGTDDLSLEQEAAYLRICNAMYISGGPIRDNNFVLCGLFRCNDRKAKRLLGELVKAGKVSLDNGMISNRRASEEISNRRRIEAERKSAGYRGGIESGKSRSKPLVNKDSPTEFASSKNEPDKIREDKIINIASAKPSDVDLFKAELACILSEERVAAIVHLRKKKKAVMTPHAGKLLAVALKACPDIGAAADEMILRNWTGIKPEWLKVNDRNDVKSQFTSTASRQSTREDYLRAELERSERSFR